MRRIRPSLCLLLLVQFCSSTPLWAQTASVEGLKSYDSQLYFEENGGQFTPEIRFQAHVHEAQIRFLTEAASFAVVREIEGANHTVAPAPKYENYRWMDERESEHEALVWNLRFAQVNPYYEIRGREALPGMINYFRGNAAANGVRGVQRYQELWYENLYPEIDLRYYGNAENKLKYDFIVRPGGTARHISLEMEGIQSFHLNEAGELVLETDWGTVLDAAPYAYQFSGGVEQAVAVGYEIRNEQSFGFVVQGPYNPELPLIIDPITLNWASFLHSSASDDYIMATVLDEDEYVYTTGYTKSLTFPVTPGVYQNVYGGGIDCYLAKMNPLGTGLVYCTYLGGADWELAYGIGVDSNKQAYMAGFARSGDYPTTYGTFQPSSGGGLVEGFLTCLSENGDSLIYSTYIGGTDRDYIYDLRVGPDGSAYMTGYSLSTDFPTTSGSISTSQSGNGDAFVIKVNPMGGSLAYSTLIGGSNYDIGNGLSLHANGEVFVVGNTGSANFPTTLGAAQSNMTTSPGLMQEDAFICRLSADGTTLKYSTYLGGGDSDGAYCVAINNTGEAFVSGVTYSSNFPTTGGAFMPAGQYQGNGDAFITRIDSSGTSWNYSTFLGGSDIEFGKAIAVNSANEAFLLGATRSVNFPVSASSSAFTSMYDLFISVLSEDGSSLPQSALFGGVYNDYPRPSGSLFLKHQNKISDLAPTHSPDMPMTAGTYQGTKTNGISDTPWIGSMEINTVLPAMLLDFQGAWDPQSQQVALRWQTEVELEVVRYEVARKAADGSWMIVHQQAGQGSESPAAYTYLDPAGSIRPGQTLYYRLAYTGVDGGSWYSPVVAVSLPGQLTSHLTLLNHPVSDLLSFEWRLDQPERAYWELMTLDGKPVRRQTGRMQDLSPETRVGANIPVSDLPRGVYLLKVQLESGIMELARVVIP